MKKRQGSALIISLLVLTFMSVSILMVSKLVIGEARITTRYQDEIIAKYAAESGMEWTLAKLKNNPDYLISSGQTINTISNPVLLPSLKVGSVDQGSPSYDIDMTRTVASAANGGATFVINKDETKEINLTSVARQHWSVKSAAFTPANCAGLNRLYVYLEIKEFKRGRNTVDVSPVKETLLNSIPNTAGGWSDIDFVPGVANDFIRIRPIVLKRTLPTSLADVGNKVTAELPSDCQVALTVNYTGSQNIDRGYAEVKSTGRFHSAKRAVGANIDNTSGRLLDIFDFVIYAGSTLDVK